MKLNVRQTVLIGLSFMSILCFWQFYDQVIPYILESEFHLPTFWANCVMALDNVLSLFMLPLFGSISDRTHTRLGRRTPYVLFGTIAAAALLVLLALMERRLYFPGFMLTLLLLLVVMSVYRAPAVAYMPDVTPKPLRSKANAIINLVGYVGGIFATLMMMLLLKSETLPDGSSGYVQGQSFTPIFLVVAAFMLISVLIMVLTVKENEAAARLNAEEDAEEEIAGDGPMPKDVLRSLLLILTSVFLWYMAYNAVTTAFSRYCVSVWGADLSASSGYLMAATVVAIASFVPLGFLSSRFGRKKTVLFGVALMTVCYAAAMLVRQPSAAMYVIFGLVGVGWAAINVNSFPMVVEMSGAGNVGRFTGYYYAFSMAAQIATPVLSGWLISNTAAGYRILFPYAVFFSACAFVTMLLVRHGDSRETVKRGLEAFDVGD
ncbi:MAG: MFS transporter [Oscillospiraceae bacterium]